jgi:hypothetical protein
MNSKTLITNPFFNLIQERDIIFIMSGRNFGSDMKVFHMRKGLVEDCKFVEVGCEEAETSDLSCDVSKRQRG